MSSIDLVILGIVLEKPQSAYDIQKDVEYHHFSRWTKISVPSIYRKVLLLSEKGYLQSDIVKGDKFADKAIYSITDQGRAYFKELMASCAAGPVPLLFDFNVVITNLNKMDKAEALELVSALRRSIQSSAESNEGYPPRLWTRPVRCLLQKSVEERGTGLSAEYEASKRS